MKIYDVFNGDADGICALVQLRLAEPIDSVLVTGAKRDIALVQRVPTSEAERVNILDISLEKNRAAVDQLLAAGCQIFYVDHHFPGDSLPQKAGFTALIDTGASTCTSLLVDRHLDGRFHNWAITAAFGDNLNAVAEELARRAGLSSQEISELRALGIYINYNGYGSSVDSLHFHPAQLYRELVQFANPLDFIAANSPAYQKLRDAYQVDMQLGLAAEVIIDTDRCKVVVLPDEAWALSVSGALGNELANANPAKACAILTSRANGSYMVSIRAPLNKRTGADKLARQFPTGGGRKAAAGINELRADQLDTFLRSMVQFWL